MKIVLRIFVVLLLILSGVALYLGIMLFNQREQIKARLSLLEQSTSDLSKQIEVDTAADLAERGIAKGNIEPRDIKQYYRIDPQTGKPMQVLDPKTGKKIPVTDGPGTMKPVLRSLLGKAVVQADTLDRTRVALQDVRNQLKRSQEKVADLKAKIATLEVVNDGHLEEIARLKEDAAQTRLTLDEKEGQILNLNSALAEANTKILKQDEQIFALKQTLTALEKRCSDLSERLKKAEELTGGSSVTISAVTHGPKGTVASVNPEWSFVVINTTPDAKLAHGVTLVIRRGSRFVGKARVLRLKPEQNAAVAEILWDWLKLPIQKGDAVEYIGE